MSSKESIYLEGLIHDECTAAMFVLKDDITLNSVNPVQGRPPGSMATVSLCAHMVGIVVQYISPDFTRFMNTYDYLVLIEGRYFKLRRSEFQIIGLGK